MFYCFIILSFYYLYIYICDTYVRTSWRTAQRTLVRTRLSAEEPSARSGAPACHDASRYHGAEVFVKQRCSWRCSERCSHSCSSDCLWYISLSQKVKYLLQEYSFVIQKYAFFVSRYDLCKAYQIISLETRTFCWKLDGASLERS